MGNIRKVIAAAIAAAALVVTVGATEANAAPVIGAKIVVTPQGQGDWPFAR